MTVNVTTRRSGPYQGNKVTTDFAFDFYIPSADALTVILEDAGGNQFVKTYKTDYAVSGIGVEGGGTVSFIVAPTAAYRVWLVGDTPLSQPSDYKNQSSFQGVKHEKSFDRATIQIQELESRSLVSTDLISRDYDALGRDINNVGAIRADDFYLGGVPVVPSDMAISLPSVEVSAFVIGDPTGAFYEAKNFAQLGLGKVVESISDLKSLDKALHSKAFVTGYYAAGDGGGGHYYHDAADTTSADNGGTIIVANDGARWKWIGVHPTVKTFGAKGDGVTDDYTSIVNAQAYLISLGGGELIFPRGTYRTTQEILWPGRMVAYVGNGRRMVYPGPNMEKSINTTSTIYADHANRNAIRFIHTAEHSTSSSMREISIITNDAPSPQRPIAAIGFDAGGTAALFQRDFTFYRVGIFNFTSAFDLYDSGASDLLQWGVFKAIDCAINRNGFIARTLNSTQWNGFVFLRNEAGQNGSTPGTGGVHISAHAVNISDNLLEGQEDPVKLVGAFRSIVVKNNYFEACTGLACVDIQQSPGSIDVGPNLYLAVTATHKVLLQSTGGGKCLDPYWWSGTAKIQFPALGVGADGERTLSENNTDVYGLFRADDPIDQIFQAIPSFTAAPVYDVTAVHGRDINPINGMPMPVETYTTAGSGAVVCNYTIAGVSTDYVVVTWLVKQIPDANAAAAPYISVAVNALPGNGGRDYEFSQALNWYRQGDWIILTAAIRLTGAMSSLQVTVFPFGVSPLAGRAARFRRPSVYVTDSSNKIKPFVDAYETRAVTASPTSGTWQQGDVLFNKSVAAINQSTFACTVSGTPGTWVYG